MSSSSHSRSLIQIFNKNKQGKSDAKQSLLAKQPAEYPEVSSLSADEKESNTAALEEGSTSTTTSNGLNGNTHIVTVASDTSLESLAITIEPTNSQSSRDPSSASSDSRTTPLLPTDSRNSESETEKELKKKKRDIVTRNFLREMHDSVAPVTRGETPLIVHSSISGIAAALAGPAQAEKIIDELPNEGQLPSYGFITATAAPCQFSFSTRNNTLFWVGAWRAQLRAMERVKETLKSPEEITAWKKITESIKEIWDIIPVKELLWVFPSIFGTYLLGLDILAEEQRWLPGVLLPDSIKNLICTYRSASSFGTNARNVHIHELSNRITRLEKAVYLLQFTPLIKAGIELLAAREKEDHRALIHILNGTYPLNDNAWLKELLGDRIINPEQIPVQSPSRSKNRLLKILFYGLIDDPNLNATDPFNAIPDPGEHTQKLFDELRYTLDCLSHYKRYKKDKLEKEKMALPGDFVAIEIKDEQSIEMAANGFVEIPIDDDKNADKTTSPTKEMTPPDYHVIDIKDDLEQPEEKKCCCCPANQCTAKNLIKWPAGFISGLPNGSLGMKAVKLFNLYFPKDGGAIELLEELCKNIDNAKLLSTILGLYFGIPSTVINTIINAGGINDIVERLKKIRQHHGTICAYIKKQGCVGIVILFFALLTAIGNGIANAAVGYLYPPKNEQGVAVTLCASNSVSFTCQGAGSLLSLSAAIKTQRKHFPLTKQAARSNDLYEFFTTLPENPKNISEEKLREQHEKECIESIAKLTTDVIGELKFSIVGVAKEQYTRAGAIGRYVKKCKTGQAPTTDPTTEEAKEINVFFTEILGIELMQAIKASVLTAQKEPAQSSQVVKTGKAVAPSPDSSAGDTLRNGRSSNAGLFAEQNNRAPLLPQTQTPVTMQRNRSTVIGYASS